MAHSFKGSGSEGTSFENWNQDTDRKIEKFIEGKEAAMSDPPAEEEPAQTPGGITENGSFDPYQGLNINIESSVQEPPAAPPSEPEHRRTWPIVLISCLMGILIALLIVIIILILGNGSNHSTAVETTAPTMDVLETVAPVETAPVETTAAEPAAVETTAPAAVSPSPSPAAQTSTEPAAVTPVSNVPDDIDNCNIENGGMMVSDGTNYYISNPDEGGKLCCLDANLNVCAVYTDYSIFWLSLYNGCLYYANGDSSSSHYLHLYRMNLDGSGETELTNYPVYGPIFSDGYIYFGMVTDTTTCENTLYRMKDDCTGAEQLSSHCYTSGIVVGPRIYFADSTDNYKGYVVDLSEGREEWCWHEGRVGSYIDYEGAGIYFTDRDDQYIYFNAYISGAGMPITDNCHASCLNVYNGVVYFTDADTGDLCSIEAGYSDTDYTVLVPGANARFINISNGYLFYTDKNESYYNMLWIG